MIAPTNKTELINQMRESRQILLDLLADIPEDRMHEIALYENWTIKDFIAHIGWWEQFTAERMAALRRGEHPDLPHGTPELNADVQNQYRDMPLNDIRVMESLGFTALEIQVEQASEDDIFTPGRFDSSIGDPLLVWIADGSYAHYDEHLDDLKACIIEKDFHK